MKKIFIFIIAMFCYIACYTQTDTAVHLYIAHDSLIVRIDQDTNGIRPVFIDTNINNILSKYSFTVFERLLPTSRIPDIRQIYRVVSDNTAVAPYWRKSF